MIRSVIRWLALAYCYFEARLETLGKPGSRSRETRANQRTAAIRMVDSTPEAAIPKTDRDDVRSPKYDERVPSLETRAFASILIVILFAVVAGFTIAVTGAVDSIAI